MPRPIVLAFNSALFPTERFGVIKVIVPPFPMPNMSTSLNTPLGTLFSPTPFTVTESLVSISILPAFPAPAVVVSSRALFRTDNSLELILRNPASPLPVGSTDVDIRVGKPLKRPKPSNVAASSTVMDIFPESPKPLVTVPKLPPFVTDT
ncbi:MAG: hypothetical protein ACFB8W_08420, partial [Elainellaceae cyanobacterium]